MARTKEFDRAAALQAAIVTFAAHGFEGTSTDDLLQSMQIGRQSLYDTFGDKRQLYLEALRSYNVASVAASVELLERAPTPLSGLEAVLLDLARNPRRLGTSTCLGVSSICEFGRSDPEVAAINDEQGKVLTRALERQARAALDAGELDPGLDPREVARLVGVTMLGLKVAAANGSSAAHLVGVAKLGLRGLRAQGKSST